MFISQFVGFGSYWQNCQCTIMYAGGPKSDQNFGFCIIVGIDRHNRTCPPFIR